MSDDQIFDLLEKRVYLALKKIADQHKIINSLMREKQDLEHLLADKQREVDQLRLELEQSLNHTDSETIEKFQEREERVKERIQELVDKIDKVRLLE